MDYTYLDMLFKLINGNNMSILGFFDDKQFLFPVFYLLNSLLVLHNGLIAISNIFLFVRLIKMRKFFVFFMCRGLVLSCT